MRQYIVDSGHIATHVSSRNHDHKSRLPEVLAGNVYVPSFDPLQHSKFGSQHCLLSCVSLLNQYGFRHTFRYYMSRPSQRRHSSENGYFKLGWQYPPVNRFFGERDRKYAHVLFSFESEEPSKMHAVTESNAVQSESRYL